MNEDLPAEVLVEFFLKATDLVQEAGYEGLVVFPDEVQQFFKKHSYSHAEEELRSIIWGFNPRTVSFGMMFSIPDEQLAVINERGADILDRVRENNLLLNLTSTYDHEFPKRLWDHYAEKYEFEDYKDEIIPEETLIAIGQYATRDDLSRGPRTVIDAMGLAVTQYIESESTFTPIEYIEAYIDNRLRFTEPQQKVRGAVAEAMAADVAETEDHERAIKLMAAFPNGVTEDVSATYGLKDTIEELSQELQGTLLTYYADGFTLVDIVEGDPDISVGSEVLRDFWREFEENDEDVADAIKAFNDHVIPKLLPSRGRGQSKTGWTVRESNQLHAQTLESYREGTFDPNYPNRGLYVRVTGRQQDIGDVYSENGIDSDADLKLGFYLDHKYLVEEGLNELEENETYQIVLDLKETLMKGDLPQRIRKLKDYMNPRSVTPLLMLALTSRINRELNSEEDNMTLAEVQSLENLRENLITETIEILFDDELRNQAPGHIRIRRLRERMVDDLFRSVMRNQYPNYHTLYKGNSITKLVGEYTSALESSVLNLGLTQKQGRRSVVVDKDALGDAFNVKNHSSLRTKLTSKYEDLIDLDWGHGDADTAEITFALHPLEQVILENFPEDEAGATLSKTKATAIAEKEGYTDEEFDQILRLLTARQYLDEEDGSLVRVETAVRKEDIEPDLEQALSRLDRVPKESSSAEQLKDTGERILTQIENTSPDDEGTLEDLREEVTNLKRSVDEEIKSQFHSNQRALEELSDRAESLKRRSESDLLDKVEVPATFNRHLNKQRTKINNQLEYQGSRAGNVASKIDKTLNDTQNPNVETVIELSETRENEKSRLEEIEGEIEKQEQYCGGFEDWRTLAGRAVDLDERIMRFTERSGEDEFENKLDRLLTRIAEQFSEHGRELLTAADTYQGEFKAIQDEFDERVGQKRKAFEREKERLENILSTANGGHPGLRVQFSEADPDQSYDNLETEFLDTLNSDVIDPMESRLSDMQRTVSRSKRFQTVPRGAEIDEIAHELESQYEALSEVSESTTDWSLQNSEEVGSEIADNLAEIRRQVDTLSDEVDALNRPVRPKSDDIQELYEKLDFGEQIQLDEILESQGEEAEDPEEIAVKLAKLFKLNLLDLSVQKRFRDLPEK
ncbi:hypothetical protein SAMN04488124_2496 [Halogeometricum limi]|uniref:Uncharacterized protein n=2 Tax=Halogeometricum limi TaxID=555875 RepID=A0A1I6HV55_9EURY|nr:hypothetical protein SAMN04488124_2496 [Halogeometricum limi]